jgi:hypothetical protein
MIFFIPGLASIRDYVNGFPASSFYFRNQLMDALGIGTDEIKIVSEAEVLKMVAAIFPFIETSLTYQERQT